MGDFSLRDFIIAGLASTISALAGVLIWLLNLRKTRAEIERLEAEKHKIRAETNNITSDRVFRELDRLAEINDEQSAVIDKQRAGILSLRKLVEECADREIEFVATERSLRLEIENLRGSQLPMNFEVPINQILKQTFPVDIPHPQTKAEQDDESS